jgi:hypothetical protein
VDIEKTDDAPLVGLDLPGGHAGPPPTVASERSKGGSPRQVKSARKVAALDRSGALERWE